MNLPALFRHWKIILLMAAIFCAGVISGAVLAVSAVSKAMAKGISFEDWPGRVLRQHQRELKLTPEQVEQIKPLLEQRLPEMLKLRDETVLKFGVVLNSLNAEIKSKLTPEQAAKFDAINRQRGEKFRKALKMDLPASADKPKA
jgi:Spy/CpxP family protein refolding chaperone